MSRLQQQSWTDFGSRNITAVSDRAVHLWGLVGSEAERKALPALAEKRARSLSGCRLNDPGLLGEARRRRRERQIQVQATSCCGKRGTDVRIGDRPAAA